MPILRPNILPTLGVPSQVVAQPRRRRSLMSQPGFYQQSPDRFTQQRDQLRQAVDSEIKPEQQSFSADPVSGDYIKQQLSSYQNRQAVPTLEPGGRVRAVDKSLVEPANFQDFYSRLGLTEELGKTMLSTATIRRQQAEQKRLMDILNQSIQAPGSVGLKGGGAVGNQGLYTGPIAKGVQQWSGITLQVMRELGIPESYLPAILRRMNQESGGNPNAINNWDSNAKKGTPSIGLMQTIGPTFNSYAGPYAGRGIRDPYANIYAGLNYAMNRYGRSHGGGDKLKGLLYAMNKPGGY